MSPLLFRSSALAAACSAVAVLSFPVIASADTSVSSAAPATTTAAPGTTAASGTTTATPAAATTTASSGTTTAATATAAAARKVGSKTLRSGDRGARVKALQTLLSSAGFKTATDGSYGSGTVTVVRKFQRAANLRTSGVADTKTLAALKNATNGSAAANASGGFDVRSTGGSQHLGDRIPLKKGMSGHDVKVLQDYLQRAGFDTSVDGEYGTGTVKSVKQFENDQQVSADGVVDASDIDLLRSLVDGDDASSATGSTSPTPAATTPGSKATVGDDGLAVAPADAPDVVKQIIAAGNEIAKTPYHYGGGHGKWQDSGYDCSGSVSYALHGAGLLDRPLTSGDFESWGDKGPGQWVTIYANAGHVYMYVAGLRFDTSGRSAAGTRWQNATRPSSGYTVVHPTGL